MKNFANSKNKFGYVYLPTPTGMAEKAAITHRFCSAKWMNTRRSRLKSELDQIEVGGLKKITR